MHFDARTFLFAHLYIDYIMENGITEELAKLRTLRGADFVKQLKAIAARKEFHSLVTDPDIFTVGGENDADYQSLLLVARKAVEHGYRVYLLPNPHDFRTADFILERRNVYKLFDLKNITGKAIVGSRLLESLGQANRVLLNMPSDYNTRLLAADIKNYFNSNTDVLEVMVFRGKKMFSIDKTMARSTSFYRILKNYYEQ